MYMYIHLNSRRHFRVLHQAHAQSWNRCHGLFCGRGIGRSLKVYQLCSPEHFTTYSSDKVHLCFTVRKLKLKKYQNKKDSNRQYLPVPCNFHKQHQHYVGCIFNIKPVLQANICTEQFTFQSWPCSHRSNFTISMLCSWNLSNSHSKHIIPIIVAE